MKTSQFGRNRFCVCMLSKREYFPTRSARKLIFSVFAIIVWTFMNGYMVLSERIILWGPPTVVTCSMLEVVLVLFYESGTSQVSQVSFLAADSQSFTVSSRDEAWLTLYNFPKYCNSSYWGKIAKNKGFFYPLFFSVSGRFVAMQKKAAIWCRNIF